MKIYGYTCLSSEDLGDGTLSETEIFIDRGKRNTALYMRYMREQFFLRDGGYLTSKFDNRSADEVINDFDKDNGHLKLVYGEDFVQFEAWERDL